MDSYRGPGRNQYDPGMIAVGPEGLTRRIRDGPDEKRSQGAMYIVQPNILTKARPIDSVQQTVNCSGNTQMSSEYEIMVSLNKTPAHTERNHQL